jgi:branched-chain amino acid transport system substrate-binding protein
MKSVAFVTEDLMWAREATTILEGYFKNAGIDYMSILFAPGAVDFSAEIARIVEFHTDVVLVDLLMSTSMTIIKQWYALKPPIIFVGASGMLSYPINIKQLGKECTDYLLTYNHIWRVPQTELTIKYFDDFVKISGEEPFGTDVTSYDGLMILAKAIEIAGTTDADAVIKALEENEFVGARGTYRFMRNHQAEYIPGVILQWQNLKATVIYPPELAAGEFQKPPWVP